jgi:EmrB/QacA subfamily drug resistance transporter
VTRDERLVLVAAILGSFVAFLDMSVVNVALPAIRRSLGGGIEAQQWIVDAYLLTLSALILIAGSLSDLYGRKRVFVGGLLGFGAASLLCAFAPGTTFLIVARGLQGVAGALLVPSSLAMIMSRFSGDAQGRAIGTWTAWTGISFIVGPLLGGALVDAGASGAAAGSSGPSGSWRWVFAINVAPIAATLLVVARLPPERTPRSDRPVDVLGAALCALGLGALTFALIEQPRIGWTAPGVSIPLVAGAALLAAFVFWERAAPAAMLDFALFRSRNFAVGNVATIAIYAGLSAATFMLALFLQQEVGFRALAAGLALLPITLIMFFLSPRFGHLAGRHGPRLFMSVGPILAGVGLWLLGRMGTHPDYARDVLPGVLVFGLGLAATVAPLTAAILSGVDEPHAGVASAINNAVARVAGLLAVAAVGARPFGLAMSVMAVLLWAGGLISAVGIRNSPPSARAGAPRR